jgi:tetratricopeptide (TPR) repeat protein
LKREILLAVTLMLMGVISEGGAASVYSDGIDAIQSRDYEEAVQIFQELTAADSQNPELWYQLGFAQRLSGNLEQALECQLQARRLAPERLDVLMEISRLHYWSGRREAGESTLNEVFRISPGHEPALELRGRLAQLGNWTHLFGMGIDGVEREYRQLETYHRARAFGVFQSPEKGNCSAPP